MPEISIVIPVYNEEECLPELLKEIHQALILLEKSYEIIFVDDCSSDSSPQILKRFQNEGPDVVKVIRLSQRSGQSFAMRKGLDAVRGNMAVTLDADLQNDPHDIPRLIEKLKTGYDVVCGWRKNRQDKPLKAFLSKLGNILQRLLTGLAVHDVSCTLRVYRKECIGDISLYREGLHRFIPLGLSLKGYKVGEIISNHRTRKFGQSKYGHKRIWKVIYDFFCVVLTRGKG